MIRNSILLFFHRCCKKDGRLLKPSRPATAIDKQILTNAFRTKFRPEIGEVWSTQSFISTHYNTRGILIEMEYGILFAADITERFSVSVNELGFNMFNTISEGVYYPYNNWNKWQYFNSSTTIDLTSCSKSSFCLYYFSPFLDGTVPVQAILGETEKWIPMSTNRIDYISLGNKGWSKEGYLDVLFSPVDVEEKVNISYILENKLYTRECTLQTGTQTVCRLFET